MYGLIKFIMHDFIIETNNKSPYKSTRLSPAYRVISPITLLSPLMFSTSAPSLNAKGTREYIMYEYYKERFLIARVISYYEIINYKRIYIYYIIN